MASLLEIRMEVMGMKRGHLVGADFQDVPAVEVLLSPAAGPGPGAPGDELRITLSDGDASNLTIGTQITVSVDLG